MKVGTDGAGSSGEPGAGFLRALLLAERLAWTGGLLGLVVWAAISAAGVMGAHRAIERFTALRAADQLHVEPPDQRLWSPKRVRAWEEAQERQAPSPLAVLRIPRIALEVPVFEGTDEWTLNRAVGHIAGTAQPGAVGNSGIAGHRDGFFRGLKDIRPGDAIEVETLQTVDVYRVERTWIVGPDDIWVLDPTPSQSVTLVTCYPFYFIGSAPQRYIVRAVRAEQEIDTEVNTATGREDSHAPVLRRP